MLSLAQECSIQNPSCPQLSEVTETLLHKIYSHYNILNTSIA